MCNQEGKIDVPQPTLLRKSHRSDVVVVNEVRRQKHSGNHQRSYHASLMCADVFLLDEIETRSDENGGRKVQYGVYRRQIGDSDHKRPATSVNNLFTSA